MKHSRLDRPYGEGDPPLKYFTLSRNPGEGERSPVDVESPAFNAEWIGCYLLRPFVSTFSSWRNAP
jgi:hypothetical protein